MTQPATNWTWVDFVFAVMCSVSRQDVTSLEDCGTLKGDLSQTDGPLPVCCFSPVLHGLVTYGVQQWGPAPLLQQ